MVKNEKVQEDFVLSFELSWLYCITVGPFWVHCVAFLLFDRTTSKETGSPRIYD